ncbi:MAG: RNA pyrophosphohydrolase [Gammaproteobacteria bacterium]|nr:MAG: RNA pyrophosphohydrolase [Gammaproteobacteria bacterium]
MIDKHGYRSNVGMIIINNENKVFWGRRIGQKSWQFPQGGIDESESLIDAMYRELWEETGLKPEHVEIVSETDDWLSYDLPKRYRRKNTVPLCIGQKQKWFLLRLVADDDAIDLNQGKKAEFDAFRWVDYWYPVRKVIYFKRQVYRNALSELCQEAGITPPQRLSPYRYQKRNKSGKQRHLHHRPNA